MSETMPKEIYATTCSIRGKVWTEYSTTGREFNYTRSDPNTITLTREELEAMLIPDVDTYDDYSAGMNAKTRELLGMIDGK